MAFGTRFKDEEPEEASPSLLDRSRMVAKFLKVGLGVGAFSVITGSLLADATTERGTGLSKIAWFVTPSDRETMRRTALAALHHDIATGSIRIDPCAIPKK